MGKKVKCVRCEALERKQKSKSVTLVKVGDRGLIPLCSACILEIEEEEKFVRSLQEEDEDEPGSEIFD